MSNVDLLLCKCGCGQEVTKPKNQYIHGHNHKGKIFVESEVRFCECGCGSTFECKVSDKRRFISGHNRRGHLWGEAQKIKCAYSSKLSLDKYGYRIKSEIRICACGCGETFECKVNSSQKFIHKHNTGWVKTKVLEELRTCICGCGRTFKCITNSEQKFIQGHRNKGTFFSDEHKNLIRLANKGKIISKETRKKLREANLGKSPSEETRKKQSKSMTEVWQNKEYKEKVLKKILSSSSTRPNRPEAKIIEILRDLSINEYKYVGNGSCVIGGKCPDFVNINSQKKLIEMFGTYWHGESRTGVSNEIHVQERKDIFKKYGYETLIIWEHELEDLEKVKEKIVNFNSKGSQCLE